MSREALAPGAEARRPAVIGRVLIIALALLVVAGPFLWITFAAFRSPSNLISPGSFEINPTLDNFSAISAADVPSAALRSAAVGLIVGLIGIVVGSMGAYAISRWRTGGITFRFAILAPTIIPPTVLVFPLLALALALNLNGTLLAVIAAHLTYVVPLITWFMIGFFNGVPRELEEQASIDGFGPFSAFLRVVIPNVLPGLGAALMLGFMLSWNELFYALILAPGEARTLPVAIASFNTFQGVQLGPMAAAILVSTVPVALLSFFVQRHLVRGMSGGSVKQ